MTESGQEHDSLQIARHRLQSTGKSVIAVCEQEVLAEADGAGLAPLLDVLEELTRETRPIYVADKVVGLAASVFLSEIAEGVFAEILSAPAHNHLSQAGLQVQYSEKVSFIENRNKTGLCPLEELALNAQDRGQAREEILEFLSRL